MDLAFVATNELINEIMTRTTFKGAIIYSQDQHKHDDQQHRDFAVNTNLHQESLMAMLGVVLGDLEANNFEEKVE